MFECLFFFCYLGAMPPSVPDGAGGYVPFTNSRVMPDGSLRPYDPALDGAYPGTPMAGYATPPGGTAPGSAYPPSAPPGGYEPYDNSTWVRPYPSPYR